MESSTQATNNAIESTKTTIELSTNRASMNNIKNGLTVYAEHIMRDFDLISLNDSGIKAMIILNP